MQGATSVNLSEPSLISIRNESMYSLKLFAPSLTVTLLSASLHSTLLPKVSAIKRSGTSVLASFMIGLALFVTLFPSMIKLSDAALTSLVCISVSSSIDTINKFLSNFFILSPLFLLYHKNSYRAICPCP